ncbi:MAG: histidine phosphatase family protein [Pyrinomonadaceae bacterium]
MSLKIFFLRHGQTAFSRTNSFCGSGLDPELTSEGLEMAEAFASAYRSTEWSAIYTSPLQRAVTTAKPLAQALGMTMHLKDELKEIGYGKWEGQSVETVSRDFHDDYIRWLADPAWNPPTGGEPAVAITHRGLSVIEEIKNLYATGNVLVVSHKATIRIILCSMLGIDVGRFRYRIVCPVGSISVIEFEQHGPLLSALADRTHLSERLRTLPGT